MPNPSRAGTAPLCRGRMLAGCVSPMGAYPLARWATPRHRRHGPAAGPEAMPHGPTGSRVQRPAISHPGQNQLRAAAPAKYGSIRAARPITAREPNSTAGPSGANTWPRQQPSPPVRMRPVGTPVLDGPEAFGRCASSGVSAVLGLLGGNLPPRWALVGPGGCPPSRFAARTRLRSVFAMQPIWADARLTAAHWVG